VQPSCPHLFSLSLSLSHIHTHTYSPVTSVFSEGGKLGYWGTTGVCTAELQSRRAEWYCVKC
jgi:hypothetical protein